MHNNKSRKSKQTNKLATVYVASGQPEAQIVKGRLEIQGIPVLLKYESAGVVFGLTIDGLGQVLVQVPAHFEDEAREILGTNIEPI
jgi:hypothetical protein